MEGVEPPRLAALDPKSSASTNSATSAVRIMKYNNAVLTFDFINFTLRTRYRHGPKGVSLIKGRAPKTDCKIND